jgi:hypothetical protein
VQNHINILFLKIKYQLKFSITLAGKVTNEFSTLISQKFAERSEPKGTKRNFAQKCALLRHS